MGGTLVNSLGGIIGPLLSVLLATKAGFTFSDSKWIVASFAAGTLFSVIIGGAFSDRFGPKATILISLFTGGGIAVALAFSPKVAFLPLLMLLGFFTDLFRPAVSALIADEMPSSKRALGFGAVRIAQNLGFSMAVPLGGFLMDWNWNALFWVDGATSLIYSLLVFQFLKPKNSKTSESKVKEILPAPVWKDKAFFASLSATFVLSLIYMTHIIVLPITITRDAGYSNKVMGLILALNGLMVFLFELPLLQNLSRFRRLDVAACGSVLIGVGLALTGVWFHWLWFTLCLIIWTVGEILTFSYFSSFISDWAPPRHRGQYLGLQQANWKMAACLCPPLFLTLYEKLSPREFWALLLVPTLLAALGLFLIGRRFDHPQKLRGKSV